MVDVPQQKQQLLGVDEEFTKCLLKLVKNVENAIFLAFVGRGTSDLEIPTFSEAPEARG